MIAIILLMMAACATPSGEGDTTLRKIISGIDGEPVVPRTANKLFIPEPVNRTGRKELSEDLLTRVKEQISLDGRLGVVPKMTGSDLILEIVISEFSIQHVEYDELSRPVKKRMRITADVKLTDIKRKKVIFLENEVQSFKTYSDLIPPIENEFRVVEDVLDELAARIRLKTITGWYTEMMNQLEKRQ